MGAHVAVKPMYSIQRWWYLPPPILFNMHAIELRASILSSPEDVVTFFHKAFEFSILLTTELFFTLPQSILIDLWPWEDSSVSGSYSQMVS